MSEVFDITGKVKLDLRDYKKQMGNLRKSLNDVRKGKGTQKGLDDAFKMRMTGTQKVKSDLASVSRTLTALKKKTDLGTLKLNTAPAMANLKALDKRMAASRKDMQKGMVPFSDKQRGGAGGMGGFIPTGDGRRGGGSTILPTQEERRRGIGSAIGGWVSGSDKHDGRNVGYRLADRGRSPLDASSIIGGATIIGMTKNAMEFQESMGMGFGKMSGLSESDKRELTEFVLQQTGDSPKTSRQGADQYEVLAGMGYSKGEIYSAFKPMLDFSVATRSDPQEAADMLSGLIQTYDQYTPASAQLVSDKVSKAINMSSLNLESLKQSSKYVDPVFAAAGISPEESLALQAMLADKNIKGSTAGTGLKNFLYGATSEKKKDVERLEKLGIRTKDADGSFSLAEVLSSLNETMKEHEAAGTSEQFVSDMVQAFGRDGASAIAALASYTPEELQEKVLQLSDANVKGATDLLVREATDNLAGDVQSLGSTIEMIFNKQLTDNEGPLRKGVQKIEDAFMWFDGLDKETQGLILKFGGLAAVLPIITFVVGRVVGAFLSIISVVGKVVGALWKIVTLPFPKTPKGTPGAPGGKGGGGKGGSGGKGGGKSDKGGGKGGGGKTAPIQPVKVIGCVKVCGGKAGGSTHTSSKGGKSNKKASDKYQGSTKQNTKNVGGFGKAVGKFATGIPVIGTLASSIWQLKDINKDNAASTLGSITGGAGGSAIGAALGSFLGPFGTAAGGLLGGWLGSAGGSKAGEYLQEKWPTKSEGGKQKVAEGQKSHPSGGAGMDGEMEASLSKAENFKSRITSIFESIGPALTAALTGVGSTIASAFTTIFESLGMILGAIGPLLAQIFSTIGSFLLTAFSTIGSIIMTVLTTIGSLLVTVFTTIGSFIITAISTIVSAVASAFMGLLGIIGSILSALFGVVVGIFSAIVGFIASAVSMIAGVVMSVFSAIVGFVVGALSTILSTFASVFMSMLSIGMSMLSALLGAVISIFSAIVGAVISAGAQVVAAVAGFMGRAVATIFSFVGQAVSAGANFVAGVARGILSGASAVISAVGSIAQQAISSFKSKLAIFSPSRVMMDIAQWIPIGIAEGIEGGAGYVTDAMDGLADGVAEGLTLSGTKDDPFKDYKRSMEELTAINPFEMPDANASMFNTRNLGSGGADGMFSGGKTNMDIEKIVVQVDQLTDLDPQLIQGAVQNVFFDKARQME